MRQIFRPRDVRPDHHALLCVADVVAVDADSGRVRIVVEVQEAGAAAPLAVEGVPLEHDVVHGWRRNVGQVLALLPRRRPDEAVLLDPDVVRVVDEAQQAGPVAVGRSPPALDRQAAKRDVRAVAGEVQEVRRCRRAREDRSLTWVGGDEDPVGRGAGERRVVGALERVGAAAHIEPDRPRVTLSARRGTTATDARSTPSCCRCRWWRRRTCGRLLTPEPPWQWRGWRRRSSERVPARLRTGGCGTAGAAW